MINAYFNHLPKNIQINLLGMGQDFDNFLHKLKVNLKKKPPVRF